MPRAKCSFLHFFKLSIWFFSEKYEAKKVLKKITFTRQCKMQTYKTGFPQQCYYFSASSPDIYY